MGVISFDPGTANLVVGYEEVVDSKKVTKMVSMRNSFLQIPNDENSKRMLEMQKVPEFEIDDRLYIAGDDAYEMARIFGKELRRPMRSGVVSSREPDAIPMMTKMVERLLKIGGAQPGWKCAYSTPADPVDVELDGVFHRSVVEGILRKNGLEPKMVFEGHAVALAELAKDKFTGIGLSWGGGMVNVCVAYRSVPVVVFSSARAGDWIDEKAAQVCGEVAPRITAVKEGKDFSLISGSPTREEAAVTSYYEAAIEYTLTNVKKRFESGKDLPRFQTPVKLVCAGGTSMVTGFADVMKRCLGKIDFPLEVSDVIVADDPLYTVCRGCLVAGSV